MAKAKKSNCKISINIEYHGATMTVLDVVASDSLHSALLDFIRLHMAKSNGFESYASRSMEVTKQRKRIEKCLMAG